MFRSSIFYLLVTVNIVIFVNCAENFLSDQETEHDDWDYERWNNETANFMTGLKIMNSKGELVELTTDDKLPEGLTIIDYRALVKYHLYKDPNNYQQLEFDKDPRDNGSFSYYDPRNPTIFITHGWMNDGNSPSCTIIRDAYLKKDNVNVIVVDWSLLASGSYLWSAKQVKNVGKVIADMMNNMIMKYQLMGSMTTLVGHSLGAHVMGCAGFRAREKIAVLYGLDPAYQLFKYASSTHRISTSDAAHVQIIHTNARYLGYLEPCGHSDIYPNGGTVQLGCSASENYCSHSRAYELFAESINTDFVAARANHLTNRCIMDPRVLMGGFNVNHTLSNGVYYLYTEDKSPFVHPYLTNMKCQNNET